MWILRYLTAQSAMSVLQVSGTSLLLATFSRHRCAQEAACAMKERRHTREEAVGALHLVGVVLVPCAQGQRTQGRSVGKLQVGKVPV